MNDGRVLLVAWYLTSQQMYGDRFHEMHIYDVEEGSNTACNINGNKRLHVSCFYLELLI